MPRVADPHVPHGGGDFISRARPPPLLLNVDLHVYPASFAAPCYAAQGRPHGTAEGGQIFKTTLPPEFLSSSRMRGGITI